jgi:hypothetical protein
MTGAEKPRRVMTIASFKYFMLVEKIMPKQEIVLLGCGDVGPYHEPIDAYSALASPVLAGADIRFGQAERVYSELGELQVQSPTSHSRLKPHMASVLTDCGFDVTSVASNHSMDWGSEAMLDSIAFLRKKGIQTIGAGRNLKESRQPVVIDREGIRVAFLLIAQFCRKDTQPVRTNLGWRPCAHTHTIGKSTIKPVPIRKLSRYPMKKIWKQWYVTWVKPRRLPTWSFYRFTGGSTIRPR